MRIEVLIKNISRREAKIELTFEERKFRFSSLTFIKVKITKNVPEYSLRFKIWSHTKLFIWNHPGKGSREDAET